MHWAYLAGEAICLWAVIFLAIGSRRYRRRWYRAEWERTHPGMSWEAWVRFQRGPDRS